jgi:hypothetical protein
MVRKRLTTCTRTAREILNHGMYADLGKQHSAAGNPCLVGKSSRRYKVAKYQDFRLSVARSDFVGRHSYLADVLRTPSTPIVYMETSVPLPVCQVSHAEVAIISTFDFIAQSSEIPGFSIICSSVRFRRTPFVLGRCIEDAQYCNRLYGDISITSDLPGIARRSCNNFDFRLYSSTSEPVFSIS